MNAHGRAFRITMLCAAAWCGAGCAAGEPPPGEQEDMATQTVQSGEARLQAYLTAESKYYIVPLPTGVERRAVETFVEDQVQRGLSLRRSRKIHRLALFYDLNESAPVFVEVLKKRELEDEDYMRAAMAVATLAWVGDAAQRSAAQSHYESMLRHASVNRHRAFMFGACDALGPKTGTDALKNWIKAEMDRIEAEMKRVGAQPGTPQGRNFEDRVKDLQSFLAGDVADLDDANAARKAIEELPGQEAKVRKLVAMYAGDTIDGVIDLNFWAAIRLIQLTRGQAPMRQLAAKEFMAACERYARQPPAGMEPEFELGRARCLRAAEFFGHELVLSDRDWLKKQEDAGTDVLALRPNWKYPSGPGGNPMR